MCSPRVEAGNVGSRSLKVTCQLEWYSSIPRVGSLVVGEKAVESLSWITFLGDFFDDPIRAYTTRKTIYGNTLDFEWYRLLTVVDTQNNQRETQTCSQPAL
jgi:hypothetical protein